LRVDRDPSPPTLGVRRAHRHGQRHPALRSASPHDRLPQVASRHPPPRRRHGPHHLPPAGLVRWPRHGSQPGTASSPTRSSPAPIGTRRGPNHGFPSPRRWRDSVRIGSFPPASVTGSIVAMTHRSHSSALRNSTSPIRSVSHSSSANGSPPSMTTFGRKRSMLSESRPPTESESLMSS